MAEVEMELDVSPHVDVGDPIDEDLIDYESDVEIGHVDQHLMSLDSKEDTENYDHQMQDDSHHTLHQSFQEVEAMEIADSNGIPAETLESKEDILATQEPDTEFLEIMDSSVTEQDHHPTEHNVEVEEIVPEQFQSISEQRSVDFQKSENANEDEAVEIDLTYEEDDSQLPATSPKSHNEQAEEGTVASPKEANTAQPDLQANDPSLNSKNSETEEKDEITWEEDDDEGGEQPNQDATVSFNPGEETIKEDEDGPSQPYTEGTTRAAQPRNELELNGEAENVEDNADLQPDTGTTTYSVPQEREEDEKEQQNTEGVTVSGELSVEDRSEMDHAYPNVGANSQYPAITVNYRGEDYPLFSVDVNGFFSDVGVLEYSLKNLLESFRTELQSEIGSNDDLVLQIDEIGLEFSEAQSETTLTTFTMRQILDIFEILVKNQDSDSTRTLYTYLSTRPNASKRYSFLLESATEGRGLTEVTHLFEPSAATATQPTALDAGENSQELELEGSPHEYREHHYEVDEIHEDAPAGENDRHEDLEYVNEGEQNGQEEEGRQQQQEEEEAGEEEQDGEKFEQVAENEGNEVGETHQFNSDENPIEDQGSPRNAHAWPATGDGGEEEEDEVDVEAQDEGDDGAGSLEEEVKNSGEVQHSQEALDDDAEEPIQGHNLGAGAEPDEITYEDDEEPDENADGDANGWDVTKESNDSSISHTILEGSEANPSILPADDEADEYDASVIVNEEHNDEQDEFAEIDWLDEPETAKGDVVTPSAGEKRSRVDATAEAEDKQDVKRRRS